MKIFQTISNSSINPFFFNRITRHVSYAPSISIQNYSSYDYSNYVTPSFPSPVVSQPLFHSQTFSNQSSFPNLNSHPPIANYHSNNHFGQFYSSPIPQNFHSSPIHQNFYSIPQILHYPTFNQIPTILTSYPVNQTLSARIPHEFYHQPIASTNNLKKFSEIGTQTEPQDFIEISNSETQINYSQSALKPQNQSLRGILRSRAQNLERNEIESGALQPSSEEQIKSELPPLPIVAKALRALNSDPRIEKVDCNQIKLSGLPQKMRYC